MSGTPQSPSPASSKSRSLKRPPFAQALRKAIERVKAELQHGDKGPTGQSPLRRPTPKDKNLM